MKIKKQHQLSCMLFSQLCLMLYQGQHPQMVEWDLFKLTVHEEDGYKISPSWYICNQTGFFFWLTVSGSLHFLLGVACCMYEPWDAAWEHGCTWILASMHSPLFCTWSIQSRWGGCSQWPVQQRPSAHYCSQKRREGPELVKSRTAVPSPSSPLQLRCCWHAGGGRKPYVVKARLVGKLLSAYQPSCVQCWCCRSLPAYPTSKGWEQSCKEHRGGQ